MKKQIFIISPVRNMQAHIMAKLLQQKDYYSKLGYNVYIPYIDTDQTVSELNICLKNIDEIKKSEFLLIYFEEDSIGSIYDIGVSMSLNKKIININEIQKTDSKSFNNLLIDYINKTNLTN